MFTDVSPARAHHAATQPERPRRSFLYVPGDRADRVAKALTTDADAVLIDLEDAVAPAAKAEARRVAVAAAQSRAADGPALWVRINPGEVGRADLGELVAAADRLDGLVLAKCEEADWLDEVAAVFGHPVALSPLIESARAVRRLDGLCSHARVDQCHLGEIDLLADLGVRSSSTSNLLDHARAELVYASAAAGIRPPIGGVHPDVRDLAGLARDSAVLAGLGFGGRPALHPTQVALINAAFSASAEELHDARRLVALYDAALAAGRGAVTDDDGRMIDEAVVRRARRVLEQDGRSR